MTVGYRTPGIHADAGMSDVVIGCTEEIRLSMTSNTAPRAVEMIPLAHACEIAVDSSDTWIAACSSSDPTTVGVSAIAQGQSREAFVERRAANGSVLSHTAIEGWTPVAVTSDSVGDAIVLAAPEPQTGQNPALHLAKVSPSGGIVWNKAQYKMAPGASVPADVAVASDNSVWVTGSMNFLLAHYDPAGNEVERVLLSNCSASDTWCPGQSVHVLSNGDVLLAGVFMQTLDLGSGLMGNASDTLSSAFVARYSSSGQYVASQVVAPNSGVSNVRLAAGPNGDVILAGENIAAAGAVGCSITPPAVAGFVARVRDDLTVSWATLVPAVLGTPAIDAEGNIYIPTKAPGNVYLLTLDSTGSSGTAHATTDGFAAAQSVVVNSTGAAYVSGDFNTNVTFGSLQLATDGAAAFLMTLQP
jgi:hypothetical protein